MQTYANRQANLSPDGEDMCKSQLQKSWMRLSVLMNGPQESPHMCCIELGLPAPPESRVSHSTPCSRLASCGLTLTHSGLEPEPTTAQMQSPLPGLLSALQLLTTIPFPVAGKGLWLPTPHDHSSPAQDWPVPQRGPKTVACPSTR